MTRRSRGHQASIGLDAARGPLVATYQTRISDYADMDRLEGDAALSAYGELVRSGAAEAVCRGCGGPVGGIAEERLHP